MRYYRPGTRGVAGRSALVRKSSGFASQGELVHQLKIGLQLEKDNEFSDSLLLDLCAFLLQMDIDPRLEISMPQGTINEFVSHVFLKPADLLTDAEERFLLRFGDASVVKIGMMHGVIRRALNATNVKMYDGQVHAAATGRKDGLRGDKRMNNGQDSEGDGVGIPEPEVNVSVG